MKCSYILELGEQRTCYGGHFTKSAKREGILSVKSLKTLPSCFEVLLTMKTTYLLYYILTTIYMSPHPHLENDWNLLSGKTMALEVCYLLKQTTRSLLSAKTRLETFSRLLRHTLKIVFST